MPVAGGFGGCQAETETVDTRRAGEACRAGEGKAVVQTLQEGASREIQGLESDEVGKQQVLAVFQLQHQLCAQLALVVFGKAIPAAVVVRSSSVLFGNVARRVFPWQRRDAVSSSTWPCCMRRWAYSTRPIAPSVASLSCSRLSSQRRSSPGRCRSICSCRSRSHRRRRAPGCTDSIRCREVRCICATRGSRSPYLTSTSWALSYQGP
jgi:hypothetical protein